ncbi:MAG: TIGR00282 family metallophosphoesterase [Oscillospiraceae bacterium]|nr:TIGR00282 family metallophosphoesterase [Oscillospiraceae bacterium]
MRILAIGDVVGENGCRFLARTLPGLKRENGIDLCVVNGENSDKSNAVTPSSAELLFSVGADIITTGNHVFRRKEVYDYLDEKRDIVRPANFESCQYGKGYTVLDTGRCCVAVINLLGAAYSNDAGNPFLCADELLEKEDIRSAKIKLVDFHAEATGEKRALAFYLDGRVSAVWGTHTHVQTADECILPKGTGYITDLGMVGTFYSCLGVDPACVIARLKDGEQVKFSHIDGKCVLSGCLFDIDESGKTRFVERIAVREP